MIKSYSLLDVSSGECSWELDGSVEWLRHGDNVGAVDEVPLAENLELGHRIAELGHHALLVVYSIKWCKKSSMSRDIGKINCI